MFNAKTVVTVGELKAFLKDLPDDTVLVEITDGYYCCFKQGRYMTFVRNYEASKDHTVDDTFELESRRVLDGKNLLFI